MESRIASQRKSLKSRLGLYFNLYLLLVLISFLLVGLFWFFGMVYPLSFLLKQLSQVPFTSFFDPPLIQTVLSTLQQSAWSVFYSALLGVPLGLVIGAHFQSTRLAAMKGLLAIPFGVPTVLVAMSWVLLLGKSGIISALGLTWLYSLKAVVLAHVFLNTPFIALWVCEARATVPLIEIEAARSLGANRIRIFYDIVLPKIRSAIQSAMVQVFLFCTMSFSIVLILGGGPPVESLETLLYASVRYDQMRFADGVRCAVWQMILAGLPWLWVLLSRRSLINIKSIRTQSIKMPKKWMRFFIYAISLCFVLPYLALFFSFDSIEKTTVLKMEFLTAFLVSLRLGVWVAGCTLVLCSAAVLVLYSRLVPMMMRRMVEVFLLLPAGLSILIFGLGWWLSYPQLLESNQKSFFVLVCLQVILFFPMAFRGLWNLCQTRKRAQFEAARSLGASLIQAFLLIELKRWKKTWASLFFMILGASFGEVAAVSLFSGAGETSLALWLLQLTQRYRFAEASTVSAVLLFWVAMCIGLGISLGTDHEERSSGVERIWR